MNGIGLLRCICDETRFGILDQLRRDGELCVNDLVKRLGKDQPLISHHLKTLRGCGIVRSRNEGKKALYAISSPQMAALISDITETSKKIPALCCDDSCC